MSLHVGKVFYDILSEIPKFNEILYSIISLKSTVQYIHLKIALAA